MADKDLFQISIRCNAIHTCIHIPIRPYMHVCVYIPYDKGFTNHQCFFHFFFVASNVVKCLAPEKSSHTHTHHTHTPWYAYQQLRTDMRQAKHHISVDIGSSCAYTSVCALIMKFTQHPAKATNVTFPVYIYKYTVSRTVVQYSRNSVWHTIRLYSARIKQSVFLHKYR